MGLFGFGGKGRVWTREIDGKRYRMAGGRFDYKKDAQLFAKQHRPRYSARVIKGRSPSTGRIAYWVYVR